MPDGFFGKGLDNVKWI